MDNDSISKNQVKHMTTSERIALTAVLAVIGLMLSYMESLIPISFGIPGFKLGLANIMTVIALYKLGFRYACEVSLVRILLSGLLFGSPFSIAYSLAGGIISLSGMDLLKHTDKFSIVGVSMAGGVLHNLGQILIAAAILSGLKIYLYFPALVFTGIVTGIINGIISHIAITKLHVHPGADYAE